MQIKLLPLKNDELKIFKTDIQAAFQVAAEKEFGITETILPEEDIDKSINSKGAIAYKAVYDNKIVGGAVVVIDEKTQHNHLDLLYVKNGFQGNHIGEQIWRSIEALHPDTIVWETCTPYFEKRNIHFYINKCGFKAVEFFNKYHIDPNESEFYENRDNDYFEGMFRFEKEMRIK